MPQRIRVGFDIVFEDDQYMGDVDWDLHDEQLRTFSEHVFFATYKKIIVKTEQIARPAHPHPSSTNGLEADRNSNCDVELMLAGDEKGGDN